ncbi:Histidine kinase [Azospirillaceae bacterium]
MENDQNHKRTILAVDDARQNIAVIKSILVPNYTVKIATSGAMALTIAQTQSPDIILLDIMMPNMDGYEVCRQLKSNETTRDIPIIFVTAMNQIEDETCGLDMGAVDYIAKPIKQSILLARIRTHIALADAVKQLAVQNKALVDTVRLREDVEHITHHDLKSPLNVILGMPQLLLMKCDLTKEQRKMIGLIEEAGYRMLDMINNSLDLFMMENGKYNFQPRQVDLLTVIRGVLAQLEMLISEKKLQIKILVDGRDVEKHQKVNVMAESLLCHSMFSNLCNNAVEASSLGDEIVINFERDRNIVTSIINKGDVPENIRERFFEKFVTTGKPNGTGLGTYSAMLIAKSQNGNISLDTSVMGQTCLRVTLPSEKEYAEESTQ